MPKGPAGQDRPADVTGNAVHVMKALTGETDDGAPDEDKAAQAMGREGGASRAASLTLERRAPLLDRADWARVIAFNWGGLPCAL